MPFGPWMGLSGLAATSYAEAFLTPDSIEIPEEDRPEFTITDRIWWRPVEGSLLRKDRLPLGFQLGSMYHMLCDRCDTKWFAEADSTPRCWFCGRFVPLNSNFKEERRRLRTEETDA